MKVGQSIQHKKPNQDDNLIPLINIVFLMLIFFMVAGQISQSDPIKVQPPSSMSDRHSSKEPLVIVVAKDGQMAVDQTLVERSQLAELINQNFQQDDDQQTFSLLLKTDADLPVEELQSVLQIIKKTGIKRISLATQKQD